MSAPNVEKQRITVFGFDSAQSNLVCIGTHACSLPDTTETSNGMAFVRTYITALIPTASTKLKPRQGLDVISISSYKNNALGKHQLIFRTHIRNANTTGEKSNPWGGCKESDLVDDTLADMGLAYKHIKWLRCQNKDKTNSSDMMEIFSLYGVLGVRLFRRNNTGNYYDAGQTPYLGQNCIGAGTGAYGDAGHGFQTWGDNEDFVDVNAWVPKVDAETATEGAWGMTPEDAKRRHIRGWEVDVDHN